MIPNIFLRNSCFDIVIKYEKIVEDTNIFDKNRLLNLSTKFGLSLVEMMYVSDTITDVAGCLGR